MNERGQLLRRVLEEVREDGIQSTREGVGVRWETRGGKIHGHRHSWGFPCGGKASRSFCCFTFLSEIRLKVLSGELG